MRGPEIPHSQGLKLARSEFEDFRRLASAAFGLDLKPGKERLVEARLGKLMRAGGFESYSDLYRRIVTDSTGRSLTAMTDALTTNHTAFLREPDHFRFLREAVLPQFGRTGRLEVWCAAAATGEEAWTLACVLNEACAPPFHIEATDISTRAIETARRGVYPAERCVPIPASWLARYFERSRGEPAEYGANAELRKHVTFSRVNLIEPFAWSRKFDVIFCRNVMIYFDPATQERLTRKLAEFLRPGGYLFVGHAESLSRFPGSLEYVRPAVYTKPAGREGAWYKSS